MQPIYDIIGNCPIPVCISFSAEKSKYVFCVDSNINVEAVCNGFVYEFLYEKDIDHAKYTKDYLVGIESPNNYILYQVVKYDISGANPFIGISSSAP